MTELRLFTTADAERYFDMLQVTLRANRAFCLRHGVRLEAFIGIRRGIHPWHATFNRIAWLRDLLAGSYRGWAIYLDADAFVADIGFDLRAWLARQDAAAMIHPPGSGKGRWDINAGVFLWNLGREEAREAARRWIAAFDAIGDADLAADADWSRVPDDQKLLHIVLREDQALQDALHADDGDLIGYQQSRWIKQYVRNAVHTPQQRLVRIAREVELALRRAGEMPTVDARRVIAAYELLTGAPPPRLEDAFAALAAPDLAALRARLGGA